VRLLAVPRAAVRSPEAIRDPRHRPRPRERLDAFGRREVHGAGEIRVDELADGRGIGAAEAADGVVRRVEPPEDLEGPTCTGAVPPGKRLDDRRRRGAQHGRRHDDERPPRVEGHRLEPLGCGELEAGRRVEPPADPGLGEERVEHGEPGLYCVVDAVPSTWSGVASDTIFAASRWGANQLSYPFFWIAAYWSPTGFRVSSATTL
jgi:hypothetical protein